MAGRRAVGRARRRLCLGLAALNLIGCERPATKPSTLTIFGGEDEVFTLAWDMPHKFLVFLPLVSRVSTGELVGVLARSWEHSPDYRSWTIQLRNDVTWHDGVRFTAHDVKFTLDLLAHPEVLWAAPDAYVVSVLDDSTYTITYRRAGPGSPLDEWTVYYPRHLLERLDPATHAEWPFWLAPVGTGPYRFVRRVPETMMEFEAYARFFRGAPRVDRVVLKFGDQDGAITELLSGTADLAHTNPTGALTLAADDRFRTYHAFWLSIGDVIAWNHRRPPFDDARVRRALTHAIDRRELHGVLNFPPTTPVFDGQLTERHLRRDTRLEPLAYDLAAAGRLLEEAGWLRGADGEARRRGGRPFRFTALVGGMFEQEKAAVFVREQLRRVGVEMEIQGGNLQLVGRRVKTGEFDAAFIRMPLSGEWSGMKLFEAGSPLGYENPRVSTLQARIREMVDPDSLDLALDALATIFRVEVPVTFLAPGVALTVAHRRVRGLSSPFRADPYAHMDEVWLESAR